MAKPRLRIHPDLVGIGNRREVLVQLRHDTPNSYRKRVAALLGDKAFEDGGPDDVPVLLKGSVNGDDVTRLSRSPYVERVTPARREEPAVAETPVPAPSAFEEAALAVGRLVTEKNRAYGDSFRVAEQFVRLLWPDGVPVEAYGDLLAFVRMFDKMKRTATDPTYGGEDPHRDLVGYAILNLVRKESQSPPSSRDHESLRLWSAMPEGGKK